jgi:dihydrofolate reductase
MNKVTSNISVSLDGFVAGPEQSLENPLGIGGERLHDWAFATAAWHRQHGSDAGEASVDSEVVDATVHEVGAYVMGRGMFGGGPGPWEEGWRGWWGDEPPFHVPVFVLTRHERPPLEMLGGTTFHFVTGGVADAASQARAAAGPDRDVQVAGGASAIQQFLAAGLLDSLQLHVVPVLLGCGARLLEHCGDPTLAPIDVVASPRVSHITYRVIG